MTKVVSANRLRDGVVVYVGAAGAWVDHLRAAAVLDDADAVEAALVAARADEALNVIVEPFVVDVTLHDGRPRAMTLRDRIRADGPTIAFGPAAQSGDLLCLIQENSRIGSYTRDHGSDRGGTRSSCHKWPASSYL